MKTGLRTPVILLFLLLVVPAPASAAEVISVAVLPFVSSSGRATPLEKTATSIVRDRLKTEPGLRLVPADRTAAVAADLGLSGGTAVGESKARHLGTLAEADIVIIGTTAATGKSLTLAARFIGVRSLRNDEVSLEGSRIGQITPLVSSFSEGLAARLLEQKDSLAFSHPEDLIVAEQRTILAGRSLPAVFLAVTEEYEGNRRSDSAAGDLLAGMLRQVGFDLATAVKNADVILFAIARGRPEDKVRSAVISAADLEIRVVDTLQGRLLFHETFTHRAVDPFASTAGSKAFCEGVLMVAGNLLPSLAPSPASSAVEAN